VSTRSVDAVIIGGGLNGLTAAAYLARSGMKVVVLEARNELGGTASTTEFAPGFRAGLVRHDIGHLPAQVIRDLDLLSNGLQIISSSADILAPSLDGPALRLTGDGTGAPGESLKSLSAKDAATWPEFAKQVASLATFLEKAYQAPVPGVDAASFDELATAAKLGLKLRGLGKKDMVAALRVLPMSIAEYVEDTFEHPLLRGLLASRGVMHTALGPKSAGTALVMLHHQVGRAAGSFRSHYRATGGSGAIATALAKCGSAAGAEIHVGSRVARILMKGGRATGVALANGDEFAAKLVISGATPHDTFIKLCDVSQLQPEFVRAVDNIRYRGVTATVQLVVDALPKWRGDTPDAARPARSIVIAHSIDYLERGYDDSKYGRVSSKPFLDVWIPTIDNPGLAPAGQHILSVHAQYAPYNLRDAGAGAGDSGIREWNAASRDQLADHVVKTLSEFAPGLAGTVRQRHVLTPKDFEEQFSLTEGNPYHGEIALDQTLFMRPVPACARYATPVPGLWLCGSGSQPGGAIPGQAGANAARAIRRAR
jgi:phytoene dehydrogenase-like protein